MTDDAESAPPRNPIEQQDPLDEPPPTGDGVDEGVQDTIAGPAGPRAPASD